ncbi:MAG: hypothetical protein O7G13_03270 [Alphaproteobacteria bacterium]|nr:hypothetical protein [Alphaproteobacteria bacterium]
MFAVGKDGGFHATSLPASAKKKSPAEAGLSLVMSYTQWRLDSAPWFRSGYRARAVVLGLVARPVGFLVPFKRIM